jgi:hypothetical protein
VISLERVRRTKSQPGVAFPLARPGAGKGMNVTRTFSPSLPPVFGGRSASVQARNVGEKGEVSSVSLDNTGENWWAMQGSNLRPLPCEGSAPLIVFVCGASESDRGDDRDQPTEKDAIVEITTSQLSRCGTGAGCDPASLLAWAPRRRLGQLVVIRSRSFVARHRVLLAPRLRAIASGFSGRARRARSLSLPLSRNRPASIRSV